MTITACRTPNVKFSSENDYLRHRHSILLNQRTLLQLKEFIFKYIFLKIIFYYQFIYFLNYFLLSMFLFVYACLLLPNCVHDQRIDVLRRTRLQGLVHETNRWATCRYRVSNFKSILKSGLRSETYLLPVTVLRFVEVAR